MGRIQLRARPKEEAFEKSPVFSKVEEDEDLKARNTLAYCEA
jgi:hypothetical protein